MLVMFVIALNWNISFAAMGGRRLLSVLSMGMMRMGMIMGMPVMGVLRAVSTGIVGSVDRVVYMGMMRIVMTSMMRMVVAMMGMTIMRARMRISRFLNGNHKAL